MKGKFTKLMLVAMMLVTVFGLAASLATVSSTATVSAATNKWSRMDLPTTLNYQMFPDSAIWDLTGADDGTLFALVEDTTGVDDLDLVDDDVDLDFVDWDGLRWAVYPAYSDVALFKSTDGGCSWTLCWHIPSSEDGVPVAVVPQPGYKDGDSSNNTIFIATGVRYQSPTITGLNGDGFANYIGGVLPVAGTPGVGNIYRSIDGCEGTFTRVTPRCPGVSAGGSITCLDVVQCPVCTTGCQDPNVALVGVSGMGINQVGEGLYSWNQNGIAIWNDMQIANSMQAPPIPGTLAASNGLHVIQVKGSPNYTTDGCIVAVVNDRQNRVANIAPYNAFGTFVCFYDANDGIWGGDIDSPTNAQDTTAPQNWQGNFPGAAAVAMGTDFNSIVSCYVFVGFDGSQLEPGFTGAAGVPSNDTVFRVRGLSTVTGPSTVADCNVGALLYAQAITSRGGAISDIMINGEVSNPQTAVYVACDYPAGQAQVLSVYNTLIWPGPVPSFKPMSGSFPTYITDAAGIVFAAGGGDGRLNNGQNVGPQGSPTAGSGISKMYVTTRGPVFNGRGILDDIAVSEDIPGFLANFGGSDYPIGGTATIGDWCLAEAMNEEVSPTYASDGIIYVTTWSEWSDDLSLWRLTDGCWERIMYEDTLLPGGVRFEAKNILTNVGLYLFANNPTETWWPRVVPQFSTDQSMFLLGARNLWAGGAFTEMLWYSPDKGNDWRAVPQMPLGTIDAIAPNNGLSEMGWWAQDSNTVFIGDVLGWIYKTTNRGASWTEGVLTGVGCEIDSIRTSPIYSDAGTAGTDKYVLVGTYDTLAFECEAWLSEDGCTVKDLENVGDEIYVSPSWGAGYLAFDLTTGGLDLGHTVVNFDKNWASNRFVYAASTGWMDAWQLVGPMAGTSLSRVAYSDVSVVRTEVDLVDPSAATWTHLWDALDWNEVALAPQPLPGMAQSVNWVYRLVAPSVIEIGPDGTVYVPFALADMSYNTPADNPSPKTFTTFTTIAITGGGRFTLGGVLRCLDGTAANAEMELCTNGRGPWDGLWQGSVVPGTNHIISLNFDWKEWRFKLAFWEDTLSGSGPAASAPADGATGIGSLMADTSVSAPVSWQAQTAATLYEWQVSEDAAFTSPKTGTSSGTSVTVAGLQAQTTYFWRVRAIEPTLGRWSTVQQFTSVPGGDTGAPAAGKPEDGGTITDTTPLFTWGKIASATNYELQVATDPGFGAADIVIDEELGDVSAYEADKELVNGTYYWRVRGTNPATDTETPWSFGSFTLDTEAEGTGTPVWVWVLIVLGVVLGIVVLVLILRTRRPV